MQKKFCLLLCSFAIFLRKYVFVLITSAIRNGAPLRNLLACGTTSQGGERHVTTKLRLQLWHVSVQKGRRETEKEREKLFPLSFIKSHAKMLQSLLTFSIFFFPVHWPSYDEKYVLKFHYWNVLNNDCQGWKLATRMNVIYSSVLQRGP